MDLKDIGVIEIIKTRSYEDENVLFKLILLMDIIRI